MWSNTMTEKNLNMKGFIQLSDLVPPLKNSKAGTEGRNPVGGALAEAIEDSCLLASSSWFA